MEFTTKQNVTGPPTHKCFKKTDSNTFVKMGHTELKRTEQHAVPLVIGRKAQNDEVKKGESFSVQFSYIVEVLLASYLPYLPHASLNILKRSIVKKASIAEVEPYVYFVTNITAVLFAAYLPRNSLK